MTNNNELTRERIEAAIKGLSEVRANLAQAIIDRYGYNYTCDSEDEYYNSMYYHDIEGLNEYDVAIACMRAELERQSVTDEEIEFAAMHTENILREHTLTNGTRKYWQTVLIALQAYRLERGEKSQ